MGLYIRRVARLTVESGSFPPSGVRTVRRTVLEGPSAMRRARLLNACGIALVVLGPVLMVLAGLVLRAIDRTPT